MTMPSSPPRERLLGALLAEIDRAAALPAAERAPALRSAARRVLAEPGVGAAIDRILQALAESPCDEVQSALLDAVDTITGRVPVDLKLSDLQAAHLAGCPECQGFRERIGWLVDDPDERAAVAAAIEPMLAAHVRQQVEALLRFTDLTEQARLLRARNKPEESVLRGDRRRGSAPVVVQQTRDDPAGRYALKMTCFLEPGAREEPPRYKVQLELCRFGETTRWREARWRLTARLDERILPAAQDRRGIWELAERVAEADLSRVACGAELLDPAE